MKGWKTIIFVVLTAALGGVDAITELVNIPDWYYVYVVPAVTLLLRAITTTPIGKSK